MASVAFININGNGRIFRAYEMQLRQTVQGRGIVRHVQRIGHLAHPVEFHEVIIVDIPGDCAQAQNIRPILRYQTRDIGSAGITDQVKPAGMLCRDGVQRRLIGSDDFGREALAAPIA